MNVDRSVAAATVAGSTLVTLGLTYLLAPRFGQAAGALIILPVALAGAFFGVRAGVILGVAISLAGGYAMSLAGVLSEGTTGASQVLIGVAVLGALGALTGRLRDLEARLRSQSATLGQRGADLERELAQRQEYADVLAHEMRNPLVAIRAAARATAREAGDAAIGRKLVQIGDEAMRALGLLESLTDASSLEAGRMRSVLAPIDLVETVRDAVKGLGDLGHPVRLDVPDWRLGVNADERRIGQVISNLVSNAAKYSPPGSPIDVSVGFSGDRTAAIVRVRDYGSGIPPAERDRLFGKFSRLSTAGGTTGSGLGLFISRGIVREHGGDVWAEFPPGGGTSFALNLPLAQPSA